MYLQEVKWDAQSTFWKHGKKTACVWSSISVKTQAYIKPSTTLLKARPLVIQAETCSSDATWQFEKWYLKNRILCDKVRFLNSNPSTQNAIFM